MARKSPPQPECRCRPTRLRRSKRSTIGGAVAVGAAGTAGIGAAGAGAWSDNTVANDVEAYIQNYSTVTTSGGNITLTAADNPAITANGGGVGIAVGVAGAAGIGLSVGVSYANNLIQDKVYTFISNSNAIAAGGVTLATTDNATIEALAIGVLPPCGAGVFGGALAGAGATTENTIDNDIESHTNSSTVTAHGGPVSISATDTSTIIADAGCSPPVWARAWSAWPQQSAL